MKTKVLLYSLVALLFAACSDNEIILDKSNNVSLRSTTNSTAKTPFSYQVDHTSLMKFLALKKKRVTDITPLTSNNDTIAYYVQYDDGWEIISADKRMAPVLIKADSGILKSPKNDGNIQNLITNIAELRKNLTTDINGIWQLWEKPKSSSKRRVARGIGQGMWIPQDTVYYDQRTGTNSIVTTKWGQNEPWNTFTKILDSKYAPVGCGPVAAGQVIYHFRKDNPRNCEIPTSAKYTNGSDTPEYSNFSSSCWPLMAREIAYVDYPNYTAIFLGYLGKQMEVTYGTDGSSVNAIKIGTALLDYKLTYNKRDSYDFYTIYSDLKGKQPVILCAETSDKKSAHAFIVNGYITESTRLKISYRWDPEHRITEWEYENYDQSMFMDDPSGNEYKENEIVLSENTYFRFNWGYSGYEDNRLYNVAYTTSSLIETTGRPDVITQETIYPPYWICGKDKNNNNIIYNRIYKVFYNIRENNY